ncbi:MAG TPA: 50S ribosomal protein L4 [Bacteroidetes bacterium]|nr:MAG: 50S ribosomal protein L4 [Bacteroidota bacterium]HHE64766.1 50S ribosomal protein L4 [Bacteroidota bacterium]
MKLKIIDIEGKETGKTVTLNKEVFEVEPNDHAIYLDVKQHMANKRQGTHKTKERSDVAGSRRKIKKQKGTGTARAGDIKNPIFRGGGRVFGPRPRDYSFKLNKKVKRLARVSALSYKAKNKAISVLNEIKIETSKTKEYVQMLENLKLDDKKTLFVISEQNNNLYLSSRNLKGTKVVTSNRLSTYDIMESQQIVFDSASVANTVKNLKA